MLAVAIALAVFAWYWRWQHGHRTAELWGPETLLLIRSAPQATLLTLETAADPEAPTGESLSVAGRTYPVAATVDLANVPGLIHARHSLTEDASYEWAPPADNCQPVWTHALRLTSDKRTTTLLFDFDCHFIGKEEAGAVAEVVPRISAGWQRVFERALSAASREQKSFGGSEAHPVSSHDRATPLSRGGRSLPR